MTNTITVTVQMGDGEASTATFGLPPGDDGDGHDFDAPPSDMVESDLDTAMPPDVESAVESAASDAAMPPDVDLDDASEMDEDDTGDDDTDDIAPPEV